jgi:4-hydroxy-3-polyprenylbenzoate decarboxylase
MHWHRHKTGANHFEAWKKEGREMPVVVTLGGDPVYTYAATAPLPEGIDEYLLAGFLRKKRVKMVKALTQDLYIPEDVDFVIEGYIDTSEDLAWEGPFGDHTGFYSLADWYPKFHITAITHRKDAVYPATIVGIPPQEDTVIGKATERLFLYPIKLTLQPDIIDIHMPAAGVAHNLVLVKIDKKYPGQGLKVINSLFGAGQMMFSKFIIVLDGDIDIFNYREVINRAFENISIPNDLMITRGPLDVLDHSSDRFSFGGKMGMDATTKLPEEILGDSKSRESKVDSQALSDQISRLEGVSEHRLESSSSGTVLFLMIDPKSEIRSTLKREAGEFMINWIFLLDKGVDKNDIDLISWQILSNTDPGRDIEFFPTTIIVDSTAKNREEFPRDWPNVVTSSTETIRRVDEIWESLNIGEFRKSPSLKYLPMLFQGEAKATRKGDLGNLSSIG